MPAVFDGVSNDMRIAKEEIFGPGGLDHPVRHRGGGDPARERHAVRPVGLGLEPRHRQGAADREGHPDRQPLGELEQLGPHRGAVRRLQDVGHRARARAWPRSTSTPRRRTSSSTSGDGGGRAGSDADDGRPPRPGRADDGAVFAPARVRGSRGADPGRRRSSSASVALAAIGAAVEGPRRRPSPSAPTAAPPRRLRADARHRRPGARRSA